MTTYTCEKVAIFAIVQWCITITVTTANVFGHEHTAQTYLFFGSETEMLEALNALEEKT
jgi:hypothetical protein